ncbi:RlpA-like double-psi beta-barrel-protein domain-containing protein-containing protein, partial [Mycena sanguinolenta]
AIWYDPNGNVGACGVPIQNSDFAVAVSPAHFQNGAACFHHLIVEYEGKNINATIEDLCPGCGVDEILLPEGAFAALAILNVGVIPVSWYFK